MDISKFIDWIKLSPKYLSALAIASGTLLFTPKNFVSALGLDTFTNEYREWIGAIFVVCAALIFTHFLSWVGAFVHPWVKQYLWIRYGKRHLHELTPDEKNILALFIEGNTRSQLLDFRSGVVNGLVQEKVLFQAASVGNFIDGIAYNIQPWAWEYLNKYPELLD